MLDRIVIVGAGRTAESLVPRLCELAPILVLDSATEPLAGLVQPSSEDASVHFFPLTTRLADGTSRFVLEEARGDAREAVGIVAATPDDRKNVEICRLAKELGYQPLIGIALDPKAVPEYEALGARAILRPAILGQVVERALRYDGLAMATTVGQGKGEIVELGVLPGSPAIGVTLADLQAEGWRVAAIYRAGELVLPTGKTSIQAEDRVVIVGDPTILPGIAAQLRMGVPMFPMPHGKHIVVYLPEGRDRAVEAEAEVLAIRTRATSLLRVYPGATPAKLLVDDTSEAPDLAPHQRSKVFEDVPLEGEGVADHVEYLRRLRPGVVVVKARSRSLWARLLGRGGEAALLCNRARSPVLFPHGSPKYGRVVHALIEGIADLGLADSAIDLARMLSLPLVVVRVTLPDYLGTPDPNADRVASLIDRRSRLYGLRAETIALTGNPVKELMRAAQPTDLFVMGRRPGTRDGFTSPDVALRVARAAVCSVLVKTVEGS